MPAAVVKERRRPSYQGAGPTFLPVNLSLAHFTRSLSEAPFSLGRRWSKAG
jgi:hypothetical protein